ncbi:hypothetical protein BS17DRAFT_768000 [Gyrodon lividus]|nr:hypothetical protein BS17DRAFT_768000 [Gyrodon lividus]
MSGLDYSTFSLCSALTPSQATIARSHPAGTIRRHVAEDDIDAGRRHTQRDDLPSSSKMTDYPRVATQTLFGSYPGQGLGSNACRLPAYALSGDSSDDIQGNILCAQLGNFHFSTTQFNGGVHGSLGEQINAPTAISETSPWNTHHSLHCPTPVHPSVSRCIKGIDPIAKDARLGSSILHCDVSHQLPAHDPTTTVIADLQLGHSYGLAGSSSSMHSVVVDVDSITTGGLISSPSPPPTSYDEDDFPEADWGRGFTYGDESPVITRMSARQPASHLPPDRQTVQSFCESQEGYSPSILPLDRRFAAMATPLPGYTSSQSPHDNPIYGLPASFSAVIHRQELPRPGSAPPLIDNQVPFVGDARAVLQSPENAVTSEDLHVTHPHGWHSPAVTPSPRSSPMRAGSIGHNSQTTPLGSRHLRRWSSVTNSALRMSPTLTASPPLHIVQFPRHSQSNNSFSHFPPSTEALTDGQSSYMLPHAAAEATTEPAVRNVIRCDGYLVDEESLNTALQKPDKLLHVYACFWDLGQSPCGMWIEGDQSSVADHLGLFHGFKGGEVATRCLWRDCPKPHMKGTSIARHVVTHVGFRVKCNTCKHEFARVDACNRAHSRSGCSGVGRPMYGDLQRVLDARKVDPLQRPSKKRRTDD